MPFAPLALSLVFAAAASSAPACEPQVLSSTVSVRIAGGRALVAEVADTPKTREIGMMCRTAVPKGRGMLFVFPFEMPLGFWMKNTLVPLDMVWIGADKTVTGVSAGVKASKLDTPDHEIARASGYGHYVLELAAGEAKRLGIRKGVKLSFPADIPRM